MSKKVLLLLITMITFTLSANAQKIDTIVYYLKTLRTGDWLSSNAVVPVSSLSASCQVKQRSGKGFFDFYYR